MTTAIVIDWGLFPELALRLARDLDHVYYHSPWASSFPDPNDTLIGKGFEDLRVERVDFPMAMSPEADVWIFPDLYYADWQESLRLEGRTVWGAGWGERIETDRWLMHRIIEDAGYPVIPADTVEGFEELEHFLFKYGGERYIKIAQYYRGAMETFHHKTWRGSQRWLNELLTKIGPANRKMKFLLEKPIAGDATEPGLDFLIVNGQPLSPAMLGYEIKGSGMISRVVDDIPETLTPVKALLDFLASEGSTTFFSCETRVINGKCYVLDPCCRMPSPGDAMHLEGWNNLTAAIMLGARGERIVLDPVAPYAAQIRLYSAPCEGARHVSMPEGIRDMVKLRRLYRDEDGELWVMPGKHPETIGGAVGFGDTPENAFESALASTKEVEMEGLEFDEDLLTKAEKEIEKGRKNGIEF